MPGEPCDHLTCSDCGESCSYFWCPSKHDPKPIKCGAPAVAGFRCEAHPRKQQQETPEGMVGGICEHRRCNRYVPYVGCRMLTDEALRPDAEDIAFGRKLVDEGWVQTSHKYRSIARWKVLPHADPSDIIKPEFLGTYRGLFLAQRWSSMVSHFPSGDHEEVERMELTIKQFSAFRMAGGGPR